MTWLNHPRAVQEYATYCAPTVVAALMDCTRREAAAYMISVGAAHPTVPGATQQEAYHDLLQDLGGEKIEVSHDHAKFTQAKAEWVNMRRHRRPTHRQFCPTVTQFLREHPEGTLVLWTTSHTLLAHDGQVVVDTKTRTKSARARMYCAYRFPDGTIDPNSLEG